MSISFIENEPCTLTEYSTNHILSCWDNGKRWVNSDFLWDLDRWMNENVEPESEDFHYVWRDFEHFYSYEKSLERGWTEMTTWFRKQNPKLVSFLDFFEMNRTL